MPVNLTNLRAAVQAFDWDKVFRASLKWTKPTDKVRTELVDNQRYTLTPIADTGGMQVYVVRGADGALPPRPTRNKIEIRLRRTQVEHILVFEDAAKQHAVLQWVKRGQQGRRAREFPYKRGDSGEPLIQKLQGIAFEIDDFDAQGRIEISQVTARVTKNLDLESVTRKFYDEFKRQREDFQTFLRGILIESDQRWYVSVMLNRLMFIYFIQAKGFLNGNPDYLRERLAWSKASLGPDRFYREFLRVLFFQGFALEAGQRSAEVNKKLGKIPYLNGGLFLPHPLEEQYGDAIDIPDSAFDKLFAFFSLWRWHLSERPGVNDREIDPDVLGYIFEKYINQKQMGAYYTRDDITGYICRNTIIPALFDKAGLSLAPLDLPRTIADYIYPAMQQAALLPTETEREHAARRARVAALLADAQAGKLTTINDAVTANLDLEELIEDLIPQLDAPKVYDLYTALAGDPKSGKLPLSVLDPTVGSGAFLFAALRILKPIYEATLDRMEALAEAKQAAGKPLAEVLAAAEEHSNRDYFVTKSIVVRNLYGVDLMAEATEICKLRLFLRMVADLDEARQIEPLPDIDFNIRAGNALVGYARPEEIGLVYSGSAVGLSPRQQKLLDEIKSVQRELTTYRNAQLQFNPSGAEGRAARKAIRERLDVVNAGLDNDLVKIGQLRKEPDGSYNTRPFHWFTAFYEILSDGGFDVIVGNPPYVEYSKVRGDQKKDGDDRYKIYGYKTESSGNLYAFAIERCLNMLGKSGHFGVIIPLSALCTQRMSPIFRLLTTKSSHLWASHFGWRPAKLFEGVNLRLSVVLARQRSGNSRQVYTTRYNKWNTEFREYLFSSLQYITAHKDVLSKDIVPKMNSEIEQTLITKMLKQDATIGLLTSSSPTFLVYYKNTGVNHWITSTDFPPRAFRGEEPSQSSRQTTISLRGQKEKDFVVCCLNSNLFFWYYTVRTNCRDLNPTDIKDFPVPPQITEDPSFTKLARNLMESLEQNSEYIVRDQKLTGSIRLQSFRPQPSKPIIDDIDRALAAHYGFTAEELEFIISYDIKYRMRRSAENGGEED